ncbi:MAG: energy transducer TonB [Acidobacteriota bacterium]
MKTQKRFAVLSFVFLFSIVLPVATAQTTRPESLRVGGQVQSTKLIHRVEPVYPEEARAARVSGTVVMQVTVDEQGVVSDVKTIRGHSLLDSAAVDAVKQWRYKPTLLNGEPVPVIATVMVQFSLDGKTSSEPMMLQLKIDSAGNLYNRAELLSIEQAVALVWQATGPIICEAHPTVSSEIVRKAVDELQGATGKQVRVVLTPPHLEPSDAEIARSQGYRLVSALLRPAALRDDRAMNELPRPLREASVVEFELTVDAAGAIVMVRQLDGAGAPGLEAELAKARIDAVQGPGAYNLKLWVTSAAR